MEKARLQYSCSADNNLNSIAYELIAESKYRLAANMLELATSEIFRKGSTELIQRLFFVNKAQAYKWMKNQEKVDSTLNALDWSASRNDFQLAFAVLKDDYIRAAELMKKIGSGKYAEVKNHDYSDWPLFQEFVKSQEFLGAYLEVYSEPFVQVTDSAAAVPVSEVISGPA